MNESDWTQRPPGQFQLRHAGAATLLARLCHELRVAPIVNAMVRWDPTQCHVSPGTLVVALILNILVDRKPLYQIEAFYRRRDLELLFSESVDVSMLNDDALGRTLDRLAAADLPSLIQSVALCAVRVGEMEVRTVHADTTSLSVYGEYEPSEKDQQFREEYPEAESLEIRHGYSKQKRPDLKQYTLGLVVSKDGVPVFGNVRDGNLNDKVWNREVLDAIQTHFLDSRRIVYVADSSLITKKNLQRLTDEKIRFISRLPENYTATQHAKRWAFSKDRWRPVGRLAQTTPKGAFYDAVSCVEEIDGVKYRLVVVRSSALDKRKQKKLERTVQSERESLSREIKRLSKLSFNCKEDALAALSTFEDEVADALHHIRGDIVAETKEQRPPGRPRRDTIYPKVTTYHLRLRLFEPTEKDRQVWLERESAFVLITSLPEKEWGDTEILEEYKNQTKVEQNFRLFKHPIMAQGTFLKSVRRVRAFAYVAILALIVAAFLQYRVRLNLKKQRRTLRLELQERQTTRPTSVALLKEIDYITVVHHTTTEGVCFRYLNDDLPEEHVHLLELAGYNPSIFIESALST